MTKKTTARPDAPRSYDPYRNLSKEERRNHMELYQRYLEAKDGEIDLAARTLSQRESYFQDLDRKPVFWDGDIDHDGFFQHFFGVGKPEIDARTVWLVAVAKANEAEGYGVDLELDRFLARGEARADVHELYLVLEELYHSRILIEACNTCGLNLTLRRPPWLRRWMIHAIFYLPESIRWIPVHAGEVLASVVLKVLRDRSDVFSAQPEVEERLRYLLNTIWTDEVCHVAFLRARLGRFALRLSNAMLPLVARALMSDVPHLSKLGCGLDELIERGRRGIEIPSEIHWMPSDD